MTRRRKRPVPDWMMPDPPRPVTMSDEDIADLVEARGVSHAALDRYHEAEITILEWAQTAFDQDPESNNDKDYTRAFYAACARFRAENGKDDAAADQASLRAASISAIGAGRPRK